MTAIFAKKDFLFVRKEGSFISRRCSSTEACQCPSRMYIYTGYYVSTIPSEECGCYDAEPLLRSAAIAYGQAPS